MSEERDQTYTELYQKRDTKKDEKYIYRRWLNSEKQRQEISTKLNVSKMKLINF
jgi:hypothetical protein